ncbi:MAG: DegT/DnrJ/EryC1/StrS family aminotransferase, partial [Bacteroidales bacterium]|nr:DegT/DnrJ/EryC1/StrS family aminotransferase [Bacteroidales bacterium]
FGGRISGRRACSFGDIATTSFFPAKPLGCYGDGGAIFTDNQQWAELADSYRVHGKGSFKYDNVRIGMNSRLDTVQAAVLQVKLEAFKNYELEAVNKAARLYSQMLADNIRKPEIPAGFGSSWAQYTLILQSSERRSKLQASLKEAGIPSMVYYPTPMSGQTAFKDVKKRSCPVAAQLCNTVLSLPIHPYIHEEEIAEVCAIVNEEEA